MSGQWLRVTKLLGGLGGVLWIAVGLAGFCIEAGICGERPWVLLETAALLCLLAGTGGFHRRFRREYGRIGTAASALVLLGLAGSLVAALLGVRAGRLDLFGFGGYPLLVLGWTVLGAVLVRRNVASRPGAFLLLLAIPLGLGAAYLSLLVLVPAFDLSVDEHFLSSGPVVVYGIAWVLVSDTM